MVWKLFTKKKKGENLMIKHMYLIILTIKQLQHENLVFARFSDNETVWLEEDPPPAVDAQYLDSSILH